MELADVVIYSPYRVGSALGNVVTAERLAKQLRESDLSVQLFAEDDALEHGRCFIVLNAWRSAAKVAQLFQNEEKSPIVLLLTGTDIHDPRVEDPEWEGRCAMEQADRLVLLQTESLKRLPAHLQAKASVILPSVSLPEEMTHRGSTGNSLRAILAGRLRPEKNVDLVIEACQSLGGGFCVEWYGAHGEPTPGLVWKSPVNQKKLWQQMMSADVFINASTEEGGANAVCEAIAMQLPVLASRIEGNIGLLGEDYPGYFSAQHAEELVTLLHRVRDEESFYTQLKEKVIQRSSLFTYERERREWVELLAELGI